MRRALPIYTKSVELYNAWASRQKVGAPALSEELCVSDSVPDASPEAG